MFTKKTIARICSALCVIVFMLSVTPLQEVHAASVLYVMPGGTGDCSSWANACNLQTALSNAISGDEIWVKAGTYTPATGTGSSSTSQLRDGVALYGGFAGAETQRDQRNPAANINAPADDLNGGAVDFNKDSKNINPMAASANGVTLNIGFAPMVVSLDPNPAMQGIHVPVTPEVQAAIDAAVANPAATNAMFSFTFQPAGTTDPYGATCQTFPAQAQTAFIAAAAIWNATIQSTVPITISACWSDLGSPTILGYSSYQYVADNFSGAPKPNTWYAPALANALHGSDLDPSAFDDYITYNSGFSWYYGTDGNVPAGQVDLVTVAAHEIAHGLNFSGSANDSGGTGRYGYGTGYPNIYDTFMEDASGTKLSSYTNPSTGLGSLLTSDSLWFDGSNANAANGSARVKIYAPSAWLGGSSYNHLDYDTFKGTPNSMMVYMIGSGSSQHNPGPVTKGLLKDLGWVLAGETPLHVKPVPSGAGNCSSWDNACSLQIALANAVSGNEIWVAAGTYLPTTGTDRTATFQLKSGVALYGGFAGTETERTQRNPATHVTTLSGDIGTLNDASDNSYHVVTGASGATLDGFTITAGNANGAAPNDGGGGMLNTSVSPALANVTFANNSAGNIGGGMSNTSGSSPTLLYVTFSSNNGGGMSNENNSNPILNSITFSDNQSYYFADGKWTGSDYGGGMHNVSSSPTLTNVTFTNNYADWDGGGMYNYSSSPTLMNVEFSGNDGGGMSNRNGSNPVLTNVTFNGNWYDYTMDASGGGMYNLSSSPTLTNVTFTNNSAILGGGLYNETSNPALTNVTFNGNKAAPPDSYTGVNLPTYGGGMLNLSSSPTLTNVTFRDNTAGNGNSSKSTGHGGGMANTRSSSPIMTNITFSGNTADYGGGMYNTYSSASIRNTILWDNSAYGSQIDNDSGTSSLSYSDIQYGCPAGSTCTDSISANPMLGSLNNYGGNTLTQPLEAGSPAIDMGDDSICPSADARGVSRPQGTHCDMGAYEYVDNGLGTGRNATFLLKSGVALYGGFVGTETLCGERNPAAHVTILSGDLNGDDVGFTNNSENAYHVVTGPTGATGAILDGFTITAGNANDGMYSNSVGGGMLNYISNLALANAIFSGNNAFYGAGIFNETSTSTLTNVTFADNVAGNNGGGMYNYTSNPTLTYVAINDNQAEFGAGMYNIRDSNPTLTNASFSGNSASQNGGGMYNGPYFNNPTLLNVTFNGNTAVNRGGGIYSYNSDPTLTNVTFSGNSADTGGGMENTSASGPMLTNVTFSGNSANTGGGMHSTGLPNVHNTIFWGNTAPNGAQMSGDIYILSDSVVQDGIPGGCPSWATCTNIITADPKLGTLGDYGGFTRTIPLLAGSSAIDTGNDSVCPATDQRGVPRPKGAHCDIGAYEYYVDTIAPTVTAFTVTTPSNSLNIPVTAFSATDNAGVTGYLITTSSTPPAADATGWSATVPTTFTVSADGDYTLYPWAKDAAGNVSEVFATPRSVSVDTHAPAVDTFTAASPSNSLAIPITAFSATDNAGVTGYLITTSSTPPATDASGWSATVPTTFTVSADGAYTLYPWAKDAAGNVSVVFASPRAVVVDSTPPMISSIILLDPSPTNHASVGFTVTFSEDVTGVDASDFSLATTGISDASVTSVSGSGSVYTVTVNTGSGNGTLRLDVPSGAAIADLALNPLAGLPYTIGEMYTVIKVFSLFLPLIMR